jgi:type I restriction enzyme S subunit
MPRSGSVALNHRAILTIDAVIVSHLCALVPTSERVTADFLYRFLSLVDMRKLTKKTTGLDSIAFSDLRLVAIPLPRLEEQRQISAVLDHADALLNKRRQALAKIEKLTQFLFLDLFGDPATNPKGWEQRKLADIGRVVTGNTPSRDNPEFFGDEIEWIKSDNLNTPHHYLSKAVEGLSRKGKAIARVAPPGSVLVTCIAGSPSCIGNAAMADREVTFNQQINALIPQDISDTCFLYAQFLVGKRLVQQASTSSMKGMVNKSKFEDITFIWPPQKQRHEFGERFQLLNALRDKQLISETKLDSLFASLQHRAFRGEL